MDFRSLILAASLLIIQIAWPLSNKDSNHYKMAMKNCEKELSMDTRILDSYHPEGLRLMLGECLADKGLAQKGIHLI